MYKKVVLACLLATPAVFGAHGAAKKAATPAKVTMKAKGKPVTGLYVGLGENISFSSKKFIPDSAKKESFFKSSANSFNTGVNIEWLHAINKIVVGGGINIGHNAIITKNGNLNGDLKTKAENDGWKLDADALKKAEENVVDARKALAEAEKKLADNKDETQNKTLEDGVATAKKDVVAKELAVINHHLASDTKETANTFAIGVAGEVGYLIKPSIIASIYGRYAASMLFKGSAEKKVWMHSDKTSAMHGFGIGVKFSYTVKNFVRIYARVGYAGLQCSGVNPKIFDSAASTEPEQLVKSLRHGVDVGIGAMFKVL